MSGFLTALVTLCLLAADASAAGRGGGILGGLFGGRNVQRTVIRQQNIIQQVPVQQAPVVFAQKTFAAQQSYGVSAVQFQRQRSFSRGFSSYSSAAAFAVPNAYAAPAVNLGVFQSPARVYYAPAAFVKPAPQIILPPVQVVQPPPVVYQPPPQVFQPPPQIVYPPAQLYQPPVHILQQPAYQVPQLRAPVVRQCPTCNY